MRKTIILTALIWGTFFLVGCTHQAAPDTTSTTAPAAEKSGETTKTGTVTSSNGSFYLTPAGGTPEAINSYSVELDQYVGKTVTVTGKYSGSVLYIGEIE